VVEVVVLIPKAILYKFIFYLNNAFIKGGARLKSMLFLNFEAKNYF